MKIDFTGVEGQKEFVLLPSGKYIATVTDYRQSEVSAGAKNAGATAISWEFTLESTVNGDDTVVNKGTEVKVEGRRVWDNMTIVDASIWRLKALLDACGFETETEIDFDPDEVVDARLVLRVSIQPKRKNKETGEEYDSRNVVKAFYPLEDGE